MVQGMAQARGSYSEYIEENPNEIFLWFDAERKVPDCPKFRRAKTTGEAIRIMATRNVYFATLGDNGIHLVNWMAECDLWPEMINLHGRDQADAAIMKRTIENYSTLYVHCISDNDGWDKPRGLMNWKRVK